jgi:hypothetical protein
LSSAQATRNFTRRSGSTKRSQHAGRLVFRVLGNTGSMLSKTSLHGLQKLGLVRITRFDLRIHALHILICEHYSSFVLANKPPSL